MTHSHQEKYDRDNYPVGAMHATQHLNPNQGTPVSVSASLDNIWVFNINANARPTSSNNEGAWLCGVFQNSLDFIRDLKEEEKYTWMKLFLRDSDTAGDIQSISTMMRWVKERIALSEMNEINNILRLADPADYSLEFSVGLLRISAKHKEDLKSWERWLKSTKQCIADLGENESEVLIGLS